MAPCGARGSGHVRGLASCESATEFLLTWDEQVQRMKVGKESWKGEKSWCCDQLGNRCTTSQLFGCCRCSNTQGANSSVSGIAMRTWFSNIITAIAPNAPIVLAGGNASSEFFHHLRYENIHNVLFAMPMWVWTTNLNAAGLSAGKFYVITRGRDRNKAMHQDFIPFL